MRIFTDFDELENIPNPVLTIGTFDGVHLGHQKIISQLNEAAEKIDGESVLFTFYPHPRMVLFPDSHGLKLLQTQVEKLDKLKRMGLKNVIVFPFTKEFSRLTAETFVRDMLVHKLNVKKIVVGYDHQFGKNREGSLELLKTMGPMFEFDVQEIPAQDIDDVNVSSTKIRNAILAGDIETANTYLGEAFELSGTVIKGDQIGRKIGYPTANIDIDSEIKIIPAKGVYAVQVELDNGESKLGMMNIGIRPTITENPYISLEVYLLDFSGDLYNQNIRVRFLSKLRDEVKFDSLTELKNQLEKDEKMVSELSVTDFL